MSKPVHSPPFLLHDMVNLSTRLRRLFAGLSAAFFICCLALLAPSAAQAAPNVLFLSTAETDTNAKAFVTQAQSLFQAEAVAGGSNFDAQIGALSSPLTPSTLSALQGADIVVIVTVKEPVNGTASQDIIKLLKTTDPKKPQTFIIFSDTCNGCQRKFNFVPFYEAIKGTAGSGDPGYNTDASGHTYHLNTASPYASSFAGTLDTLALYHFAWMKDVPSDFALYTQYPNNLTYSAGIFLPHGKLSTGKTNAGACTFLVGDASVFSTESYIPSGQPAKIAKAFMNAATSQCKASVTPGSAASVPTVSEVTLLLSSFALAGAAAPALRRRKKQGK